MNFKTATFREALGKRGMTVARLARAAKMNPTQLRHVLNEKRRGRLTWRRIEDLIDAKERALIVELYGPVFGEEPIEVAADETSAVEVTRSFQGREIEEAMNYLIKGRDNPAVVKRTDFVLTHFAEYVRGT